MTDEERKKMCKYLNSVRANFTDCCKYPLLVIKRAPYNECVAQCKNFTFKHCCMSVCTFRKIGVLNEVTNEDEAPPPSEVDWTSLVSSFMMSVKGDDQWLPVINASVYRCYTQFSESNMGMHCAVIPLNLYYVIDCSYDENFLKCPPWNLNNIKACADTWNYVKKCG